MSRAKASLTISCDEETKEALELLAIEFGCTWGGQPNISKFVEKIALREIPIQRPNKITSARTLIRQAVKILREAIVSLEAL